MKPNPAHVKIAAGFVLALAGAMLLLISLHDIFSGRFSGNRGLAFPLLSILVELGALGFGIFLVRGAGVTPGLVGGAEADRLGDEFDQTGSSSLEPELRHELDAVQTAELAAKAQVERNDATKQMATGALIALTTGICTWSLKSVDSGLFAIGWVLPALGVGIILRGLLRISSLDAMDNRRPAPAPAFAEPSVADRSHQVQGSPSRIAHTAKWRGIAMVVAGAALLLLGGMFAAIGTPIVMEQITRGGGLLYNLHRLGTLATAWAFPLLGVEIIRRGWRHLKGR